MSHKIVLAIAAVAAFTLGGCDQPVPIQKISDSSELKKWIGKGVTIQFRRDALGAAHDLPISPDTGEINGASTSIVGKLISVTDTSVTIERNGTTHWVPRETILLIRVNE